MIRSVSINILVLKFIHCELSQGSITKIKYSGGMKIQKVTKYSTIAVIRRASLLTQMHPHPQTNKKQFLASSDKQKIKLEFMAHCSQA